MKNKITYIILGAVILIGVMVWNAVSEPGIDDLKGGFKEAAFIRNEQNSGPVVRIYAVTLERELWDEMEQYGNYMPHTKYGTTRIYFFRNDKPYPTTVSVGDNNIPGEMQENCVAMYEKDGMSQVKLYKHPFRNRFPGNSKYGY